MRICLIFIVFAMSITLQAQEENKLADGVLHSAVLFDATLDSSIACYRIPSIITAPNGHLIAAIDERVPSCGDLKWSKDINIVIRRSSDNGKTWSDIERIIDFPLGQSASDPSMIVDHLSEEIFLFYNFMDLENEKDIYYLHVVKSTDSGKSWSEPEDITGQISKAEWRQDFKFITSGRGIQTRSGKLLHCLVNLDHGMHLFGSDDHGKNWYLFDTPIIPGNESKVVELNDGSWMVNSRLNNPGYRQVHISDDEGKTWKSREAHDLIDPGCNASIIRYTSPKKDVSCLLFANARHAKERQNMSIMLSYDEGVTWTVGKTIYSGSSAYSSMTVMEDGNIGLLFEKDDYQENVFVSISIEDLLTSVEDK